MTGTLGRCSSQAILFAVPGSTSSGGSSSCCSGSAQRRSGIRRVPLMAGPGRAPASRRRDRVRGRTWSSACWHWPRRHHRHRWPARGSDVANAPRETRRAGVMTMLVRGRLL